MSIRGGMFTSRPVNENSAAAAMAGSLSLLVLISCVLPKGFSKISRKVSILGSPIIASGRSQRVFSKKSALLDLGLVIIFQSLPFPLRGEKASQASDGAGGGGERRI